MNGVHHEARHSYAQGLSARNLGGVVSRAIRSHQLWLTVAYFAILLLLARAYA
jgi:hypothetical protein